MIDLYSWTTPNGHKLHIMLEETGLDYRIHPVDISAGDQFDPDFLGISPNNKIPAMVDREGPHGKPFSLFESGAMLIYLAEKTGHFLPVDPQYRYETLAWLMFQMASVGPMLGQAHHFLRYAAEKIPYAIERYTNEANRLYHILNKRLQQRKWLVGDEYTIADIACFPWLRTQGDQGVDIHEYKHVERWINRINARPAVQRGLAVLKGHQKKEGNEEEAHRNMFGTKQYERR